MKISIDENVCKKNKIKFEELLICLLVKLGTKIPEVMDSMVDKEMIVQNEEGEYLITPRWADNTDTVLLDSDTDMIPESRLDDLIPKLQEIFPEGKKLNTSQYWRGNKREIGLRLKKFFKLYGKNYTDEQILEATSNYVKGFNGNYSYMRVLKYFIWKDERRTMENGELKIIEVSDLANYIENPNSQNTMKEDWTSTIN